MGRGRAKAKQTKVARELKYGGPGMDLNRLRTDLATAPSSVDEEIEAAYAALSHEDDDDEDSYGLEDDDED